MKRITQLFAAVLAAIWMLPIVLLAQPNVSGAQSGTLGPGIYVVVGDIWIPEGETLTIVPMTTFLHSGSYKWDIYGQLNAEGAESDSIYFIRQNPIPEHHWYGLRFQEGASDASAIDYCVIDNCKIYWSLYLPGGGIHTNGVDITVTNTRISNCGAYGYWFGGGIRAENASITVEKCLIVDNTDSSGTGGGISLVDCHGASIMYNEIARNLSWDD